MNAGPYKVKGQPGVIFFDAAGTLIHLAQPVGWHYARAARDHGLEADQDAMERAFRSVWKESGHRPAGNTPREDDDRPWWRNVACETLRRAASPPPSFDTGAWFADLYERFAEPGVWSLYEDIVPCLDHLAGKSRLAVISNFDGRLRRILADLQILDRFEQLFISSEVGAEKPSPEIFHHAASAMHEEPARCLHVGDDPGRDLAGARAAGIEALLVDRPGTTLERLRALYP